MIPNLVSTDEINYDGSTMSFRYGSDGASLTTYTYTAPNLAMDFPALVAHIAVDMAFYNIPVELRYDSSDGKLWLTSIEGSGNTFIVTLIWTGDAFTEVLGGDSSDANDDKGWIVHIDPVLGYSRESYYWGSSRFPFDFALINSTLTGGVEDKAILTMKLAGKDYVTVNGISSNKVIVRKGWTFPIRLDSDQIGWVSNWLEYVRNGVVNIINGSDFNFDDMVDYNVLVAATDQYTNIYGYKDVVGGELKILKVGQA